MSLTALNLKAQLQFWSREFDRRVIQESHDETGIEHARRMKEICSDEYNQELARMEGYN
jgi:hypothetical protein